MVVVDPGALALLPLLLLLVSLLLLLQRSTHCIDLSVQCRLRYVVV
jgi:hypothetical protein